VKYSLIKIWRRHVNGTDSGIEPLAKILTDFQWQLIVFLLGTPFSFNETTTRNKLETSISLKDLNYRVTSP
jgi:hypothetical protein